MRERVYRAFMLQQESWVGSPSSQHCAAAYQSPQRAAQHGGERVQDPDGGPEQESCRSHGICLMWFNSVSFPEQAGAYIGLPACSPGATVPVHQIKPAQAATLGGADFCVVPGGLVSPASAGRLARPAGFPGQLRGRAAAVLLSLRRPPVAA